ncbi:MAG: RDD family protein [Pseudomonadota bacterium]
MTDRRAAADAKLRRAFVTAEGVDLRLQLGSAGERAMAFIIDGAIMFVTLILLRLVAGIFFDAGGEMTQQTVAILWQLGAFALRNGYFIAFELGTRAATPGKRAMKLRVVARDGGRLTGEAVIARNLMRELEFFLPITFLFSAADEGWLGLAAWAAAAAVVLVFLLFPLFNRDRLRVGDLVAGTWVVRVPRHQLGRTVGAQAREAHYVFTDAQLGAYGEFELQKLEEVLRREDELSLIVVARTIRGRIGWTGGSDDDYAFLQAYYTALCQRLERGMLFGKRRADKHQAG